MIHDYNEDECDASGPWTAVTMLAVLIIGGLLWYCLIKWIGK
jgi:hypothetical protein